jgi:hypothetical protein
MEGLVYNAAVLENADVITPPPTRPNNAASSKIARFWVQNSTCLGAKQHVFGCKTARVWETRVM